MCKDAEVVDSTLFEVQESVQTPERISTQIASRLATAWEGQSMEKESPHRESTRGWEILMEWLKRRSRHWDPVSDTRTASAKLCSESDEASPGLLVPGAYATNKAVCSGRFEGWLRLCLFQETRQGRPSSELSGMKQAVADFATAAPVCVRT